MRSSTEVNIRAEFTEDRDSYKLSKPDLQAAPMSSGSYITQRTQVLG